MKKSLGLLVVIVIIYLFSRIISLFQLPIFIDEAFYLMLGNQIQLGQVNPWIALFHGNPPFFSWYLSVLLKVFAFNPLLVGRVSSLLLGLVVMLMLYIIGSQRFTLQVGLIAALLYTLVPFSLMYDRLTLIEPVLQVLGIIILWLISSKQITYQRSVFIGIVLGIGFLTKTSALFFLLLCLLLLIYQKKDKWYMHFFLMSFVAFLLFSVVLFNPLYLRLGEFNQVFITTLPEIVQNPFNFFKNNFILFLSWTNYYWGIGIALTLIIGVVMLLKERQMNLNLLLILWIVIVLGTEIFTAKIFYPRYFFFLTSFICLSSAVLLNYMLKKYVKRYVFIIILLIICPFIYKDYILLKDIRLANIPAVERWQFLEGWPSGYGIDKMLDFINGSSTKQKAEYLIEEYNLPYFVLNLYQNKLNEPTISASVPSINPSANLTDYFRTDLSLKYLMINQLQEVPSTWDVRLIGLYPKVDNKTAIRIYQVNL